MRESTSRNFDSVTRFSTLHSRIHFDASFAASSSSAVRGRFNEFAEFSVDIDMNETNELRNPDSTLTDGVRRESARRSLTLNKKKCVILANFLTFFWCAHLATYIFLSIHLFNEPRLGTGIDPGIANTTSMDEIRPHDFSIASRVLYPLDRTFALTFLC